jgi:hypothetical protein
MLISEPRSCSISLSIILHYLLFQYSTGNPIPSSNNPFVGAFVFPHGGITLDAPTRDFSQDPGYTPETPDLSKRLHNAMRSAAASLVQSKPDLIILSTPHGFLLEDHYAIIGAPEVRSFPSFVESPLEYIQYEKITYCFS